MAQSSRKERPWINQTQPASVPFARSRLRPMPSGASIVVLGSAQNGLRTMGSAPTARNRSTPKRSSASTANRHWSAALESMRDVTGCRKAQYSRPSIAVFQARELSNPNSGPWPSSVRNGWETTSSWVALSIRTARYIVKVGMNASVSACLSWAVSSPVFGYATFSDGWPLAGPTRSFFDGMGARLGRPACGRPV